MAAQIQRDNAARVAAMPVAPAYARASEPDPVTRVLDADFWDTGEAPTLRLPIR